jgi:cobalt-precorrin 5A hydrolase
VIVAGFGYRSGADAAALRAALALAAEGRSVDALAAPHDKAALLESLGLGLPVIAIDPAALVATETLTRSPASLAARGTGSVAEASALAAAGPGARLLGARQLSPDRMASCAIAQGASS